jgi:3-oxoadipate enol-lactonase/4-carboxymuconolactone decarboxylase
MFIRAGDLNVHVRLDGPPGAPTLLLLHPLGGTGAVWDAQAAGLSHAFRVVRPDMRGHGLTTVTPGPYSIAGLARDALAVLDALGVASAHVGGISISGMVAQSLAAMAPGRVLSLVLADTAMSIPPAEVWHLRAAAVRAHGMAPLVDSVMARWVTPSFQSDPAALGLAAMLRRTDPEGYAGAAEAIAGTDLSAGTASLRLPCLVLVGDQDTSTPPASARAIAAVVPGARLQVIEGAGHIPPVQQPAAVTAAMRGFLEAPASDWHEGGMAMRRQVLGAVHVDRANAAITDMDRDFQHFITRTAWGGVWTRPGLDRRTRSLLTMGLMAAGGHHEELALHVRAAAGNGVTPSDIAELFIQVAAYAGIPAANGAMRVAKETLHPAEKPHRH